MTTSYMQVNGINIESVSPGIVVYEGNPYYYIEYIKGDIGGTVIAYNISSNSLQAFKDKFREDKSLDYSLLEKDGTAKTLKRVKVSTSNNATSLTRALVKKLGKGNDVITYKHLYYPPIFVAPVAMGNDSITQSYQQGFYEMEKASVGGANSNSYPVPKPTGVFVGFNNVFWKDITISVNEWGNFIADLYLTYQTYFRSKK